MKYKVVFDTNILRNEESISEFFGSHNELEKFSKISKILIPDIVVEEVRNQKRRYLSDQRASLVLNDFGKLMGVDAGQANSFDIDQHILELQKSESVSHLIITLSGQDALEKIKKLSLGNHAPFDKKTDKGFKDAYIYFTILEYLDTLPDTEDIFFVTKDKRLKEAFNNIPRVTVVEDFEAFEMHIDRYFKSEYFLKQLADKLELSENITESSIQSTHFNHEENWVLEVSCDGQTFFVLIDFSTRDIMDWTEQNYVQLLKKLAYSGTFAATHFMIYTLKHCTQYFSQEDIKNVIEAFLSNPQIHMIAIDNDVEEFFVPIYKALPSATISPEMKLFEEYFIHLGHRFN